MILFRNLLKAASFWLDDVKHFVETVKENLRALEAQGQFLIYGAMQFFRDEKFVKKFFLQCAGMRNFRG